MCAGCRGCEHLVPIQDAGEPDLQMACAGHGGGTVAPFTPAVMAPVPPPMVAIPESVAIVVELVNGTTYKANRSQLDRLDHKWLICQYFALALL